MIDVIHGMYHHGHPRHGHSPIRPLSFTRGKRNLMAVNGVKASELRFSFTALGSGSKTKIMPHNVLFVTEGYKRRAPLPVSVSTTFHFSALPSILT